MKQILFENILPQVRKPARYTGGELNSIKKDWNKTSLKIALTYPDTYEIGMSNLGLQILYHILNKQNNVLAERVFAPWPDMEEKLRENKLPLFSLESTKPINQFDMLGFSLGHELTYTNVLNMLDLAGIPLKSKERNNEHPLIFAGGPCTFNPTPLTDFIDFFVIGEAEEVILEIAQLVLKEKGTREETLKKLAKIEGIYVPALGNKAKKRIVLNLDNIDYPTAPIVPFIEVVHDRAVVEIMRGCIHGCRFCQAGFTCRPMRLRNPQKIIEIAKELLSSTGYKEISLISLSSSDYPNLSSVVREMGKFTLPKKVSISLPSLRMDNITFELMRQVEAIRPTGITLAPEAGTQRLRNIINKNLSEEEILKAVETAFQEGAKHIKLYFMIGLPTETQEDIQGIVDLSRKILKTGQEVFFARGKSKKMAKITVNLSTFIPKPFTPFQWASMIELSEIYQRQKFLKDTLKEKAIELRWHDPKASILEGVFARGDHRLNQVLEEAHKLGAKFDAWSEHFNFSLWEKAFTNAGIDYQAYLKEKNKNDPLPWDKIEVGGAEKAKLCTACA